MKKVKCPNCAREKEVEDNVILAICPSCQIEMLPVKETKVIPSFFDLDRYLALHAKIEC